MRNATIRTVLFVLGISLLPFGASAQETDSVAVAPADTTVESQAEVQFSATYFDSTGTEADTSFTWSVTDTTVGTVDSTGLFTADSEGESDVIAAVGSVSDTATVTVESVSSLDSIAVQPEDTTIAKGQTAQFTATVFDTAGTEVDTTLSWSVDGDPIGSVDSTGLFSAEAAGTGFVRASVGELTGQADVIVEDSTADTTGTQIVKIIRPKPSPQAPPDTIEVEEGGSYTLGGFPHPLQLLNGGVLSFPHGSLTEDIELLIEIEGFAEVVGDSVDFPNGVVTGADFTVQIDGEPADSSYTFAEPITLALPFKRGVLKNMGLTPQDLSMFFYDTETESLEEEGITDVTVDSTENRIFANVHHFTPVVLASETEATPIAEEEKTRELPTGFALHGNYPNPFNPSTVIPYALPEAAEVRLTVYDALGRRVRVLTDGVQPAGTHQVVFRARGLPSGLYFYRLRANQRLIQTRSMTLAK